MTSIQMYTVDAFTDKNFSGNTCAVCIFPEWPDDDVLLKIAKQNLFAETAFIVLQDNDLPELRWFTVSQEVNFCGYGTLSAGWVYLNHLRSGQNSISFQTRNYGALNVIKECDWYYIETKPNRVLESITDPNIGKALRYEPKELITSERGDLLIICDTDMVDRIKPDFNRLMACGYYGYILTACGDDCDFIYRYFSPRMTNVWEDPVSGASLSVLIPYWSETLQKSELTINAVSERGGQIRGEYDSKNNVRIGGQVSLYSKANIFLSS